MIDRVGRLIANRRRTRNVELRALAAQADVPVELAARLEAGERGISVLELERLAIALDLDLTSLMRGVERDRAEPSVFLRHQGQQDFNDADLPVLDAALSQGRALRELARSLNLALVSAERYADTTHPPAHDGYERARTLRRVLSLGGEPIADVRAVAEDRLGIAVVVRALSATRLTAVAVRTEDAAVIVLSAEDQERRAQPALARVHIAHELCHILHDRSIGGVHLVADVHGDEQSLADEKRARAFAAELLLPKAGLVERLGQPSAVAAPNEALRLVREARSTFLTPHEIAVNHLVNLGFIDGALRETLITQPGGLQIMAPKLPRSGAPSLRVELLARQAHDAALLTDGQVRRLLELDVSQRIPWDDSA